MAGHLVVGSDRAQPNPPVWSPRYLDVRYFGWLSFKRFMVPLMTVVFDLHAHF
jgi:hypothetical protein